MFKKGDRVRITASIYSGHPSRMVGGRGGDGRLLSAWVSESGDVYGVGVMRSEREARSFLWWMLFVLLLTTIGSLISSRW